MPLIGPDNELHIAFVLFITGFIASSFGSLVGGAAFITIPVMTALGFPLTAAISSNAFSNIGLNLGGFNRLRKNKLVHYKTGIFLSVCAFIGSLIGSHVLILTPAFYVKGVFIIALLSMLLFTLLRPHLGMNVRVVQTISKKNLLIVGIGAIALGAYSGFLGAGVGTLYTYGLTIFFGQSFLQSTATKKIPGLVQAFGAWLTFSLNNKMVYSAAIPLLIGMYLGSEIGVYFGIKWGNKFIKILLLMIVTVLIIKFLY